MMKKRIFLCTVIVVGALGVSIGGLALYSAHVYRRTSAAHLEMQDIEVMFKASAGELMFGEVHPVSVQVSNGTGLDALFSAQKQEPGDGIITAYQRDPKRFKHFAELFDTVANAKLVGEAVDANRAAFSLPMLSADLPLQSSVKLDPWHHPYCISTSKGTLVVVSGGPGASSFSCDNQHVSAEQIASAAKKVFQTADGEIVLLLPPRPVARKH